MLGAVSSTRFRFGPFELDGGTGELRKHGIHMRLPKQPSQILTILLTANRIVTREELRQQTRVAALKLTYRHFKPHPIRHYGELPGRSQRTVPPFCAGGPMEKSFSISVAITGS